MEAWQSSKLSDEVRLLGGAIGEDTPVSTRLTISMIVAAAGKIRRTPVLGV